MREQVEQRLEKLKGEFENGQKVMTDLDFRRATVRDTLLRISGAIQILEEMLNGKPNSEAMFEDSEGPKEQRSAAE